MGANEIQKFVIKPFKKFGANCVCCVKKYTFHSCLMLFACVLYKLFPPVFIVLVYSSPLLAFLVHRVFRRMERPKVKSVAAKTKRWKELQSRRSFKSLHRVHLPKQHNKSSFMQDPPGARQNAKATTNKILNIMSAKDNKDCNKNPVEKQAMKPKQIQELTPVDHNRSNEEYRKSCFDIEAKEKQEAHRIKTVRWLDEAEKSLMDLGITEDDRSKRLETLMERRRSKKLSSFQDRKTGLGFSIGNTSCGQIPSINIPKKNPFLADSSHDPDTPSPVSAPSYMAKSNPFDLPYDPHEEKPILTGDKFEGDDFKATHHKETSRLGSFAPPQFTNFKPRTSFRGNFSIKQLPCGKLVTSTVANKEDDEKRGSKQNPNSRTNDNNVKAEEKSDDKSSEKAVGIPEKANRIEKNTKEKETEHESAINESSSSSSSEDERVMRRRPNKEAILHCLSMSRMRSLSRDKSLNRHAETFECRPSSLLEKSKSECFLGGNKRVLYASTNSLASDLQVEVSEVGSPLTTSLHERLNSFDMDLNDVRLSDVDDFSDHSSVESGFSRTDHDLEERNDSYGNIEERCTFEKL